MAVLRDMLYIVSGDASRPSAVSPLVWSYGQMLPGDERSRLGTGRLLDCHSVLVPLTGFISPYDYVPYLNPDAWNTYSTSADIRWAPLLSASIKALHIFPRWRLQIEARLNRV